jgi:acetyl esterase/lipase
MKIEKFCPIEWSFHNMMYGADASQKIDLFIPKEKAVHVIAYIHGGAYLVGNKSQYPSFLADYSKNNILAAINYRLINENNNIGMKDILSDIHDALVKIIKVSNSNGAAVKDFILIGHSAGGHIALLYGYKYSQKEENIKIASCVSMAGPTDFSDDLGWSSMAMWGEKLEARLSFLSGIGSRLTGHAIELAQPNWTKQKNYSMFKKYIMDISPISYVSKTRKIPSTLLIHARNDDQVPYSNSVRLKTALDCASIPHALITPTGDGNSHMLGGELFASDSPILFKNQIWVSETKEWIEAYLQ